MPSRTCLWTCPTSGRHRVNRRLAPPLKFFRCSSLRAARPRIAFDFLVPGRYRLLSKNAVDAATCALSHRVFHDAVLERVKTDYDQASARLKDLGRRVTAEQRLQVIQFTVYEDSDPLESQSRWMNSLVFHCPERARYNLREMSGCCYRTRPDNGSGDSPRPPFLTEFVNHIREVFFVHAIYHLIGGTLALRVHPHVERSFRLKTESALGIVQLQRAQPDIGQQPIREVRGKARADFGKARMQQRDLRPVVFQFLWRVRQTFAGDLQCVGVFIEGDQTTLSAEALCDFVTVSAQPQGRVDIDPAAL